jgi:hypothetical protein
MGRSFQLLVAARYHVIGTTTVSEYAPGFVAVNGVARPYISCETLQCRETMKPPETTTLELAPPHTLACWLVV